MRKLTGTVSCSSTENLQGTFHAEISTTGSRLSKMCGDSSNTFQKRLRGRPYQKDLHLLSSSSWPCRQTGDWTLRGKGWGTLLNHSLLQ